MTTTTALPAEEQRLKAGILLVRVRRAFAYFRSHQLTTEQERLQKGLTTNFVISYAAATAYLSVANLSTTIFHYYEVMALI